MYRYLTICFGFLYISFSGLAIAQNPTKISYNEYVYKKYTKESGLPSNNVFCVREDGNGLLWFGTEQGVAVFDGIDFQELTTENGLADNAVIEIHEDAKGRIWFLSVSGKICFYYQGRIFNQYNTPFLRELKMTNFCSTYYEDYLGNIYFGSSSGELFLLSFRDTVKRISSNTDINKRYRWIINVMPIESDSLLVFVDVDTAESYSLGSKNLFRTFDFDENTKNFLPVKSAVLSDGSIVMVWATNVGFVGRDLSFKQIENTIPSNNLNQILFINESRNKKLWLGTANGAFLIDRDSLGTTFGKSFLVGEQVQYIFDDRDGGVWFCTTSGIFYQPPIPFIEANTLQSSSLDGVSCIDQDVENKIFIGFENGSLASLNFRDSVLSYLLPKSSFLRNPVFRVSRSKTGSVYCHSQKTFIEIGENGIRHSFAGKIVEMESSKNGICVCSPRGVYLGPEETLEVAAKNRKDIAGRTSAITGRCGFVEVDMIGRFWIVVNEVLYIADNKEIFSAGFISALIKTGNMTFLGINNKTLFAGTDALGGMEVDNGTLTKWNRSNGLASNNVRGIMHYMQNTKVILTKEGISIITNHGNAYRVRSSNFSGDCQDMAITGDDVVLLGDNKLFRLSGIKNNDKFIPNIPTIVRVTADGVTWNPSSVIVFDNKKFSMKVDFTSFGFLDNSTRRFRYRIIGHKLEWIEARERSVHISNLGPGSYELHIQSRRADSGWSSTFAKVLFQVKRPAYVGLIPFMFFSILIIIFFGLLFKTFEVALRVREKSKRRAIENAQSALVMQMNPHFIFNSLNSIQNFFLANPGPKANEFLTKFSYLVRMILHNSRRNFVSLEEEIRMLELYLEIESIRAGNNFDYRIKCDISFQHNEVFVPTLMIQPVIENSIWHGIIPSKDRGSIEVIFLQKQNYLVCTVTDSGIGRLSSIVEKAKKINKHQSLATIILNERLELLNKSSRLLYEYQIEDLYSNEGSPLGTRVTFFFPIITRK